MSAMRTKIAFLLVALALIAVLVPVCGCGGQKNTASTSAGSTCPTSAPQSSAQPPPETAPATVPSGPSKSEETLKTAAAEGKPVLLSFRSASCAPCIQMGDTLEQLKPEYEGRVPIIWVNVYDPSEETLLTQYGIQTIPTTIFVGKDGQTKNGIVGVMDPDSIRAQLNQLLQ